MGGGERLILYFTIYNSINLQGFCILRVKREALIVWLVLFLRPLKAFNSSSLALFEGQPAADPP